MKHTPILLGSILPYRPIPPRTQERFSPRDENMKSSIRAKPDYRGHEGGADLVPKPTFFDLL